jgi:hypothetical protein
MSRTSGKQMIDRDMSSQRLEYSTDPVSSILLQESVDRSDTERIIEESPNRRYAKVLMIDADESSTRKRSI